MNAATDCSDAEFPWPEFIACAREVQQWRALAEPYAELLREIVLCIPSSAHSDRWDVDCDTLLRDMANTLDAMTKETS